jgi:hypothetical protein
VPVQCQCQCQCDSGHNLRPFPKELRHSSLESRPLTLALALASLQVEKCPDPGQDVVRLDRNWLNGCFIELSDKLLSLSC